MPRPRKCRKISETPKVTYFKPRGVPMNELVESRITYEELEAIRLADLEGLTMEEASGRMHVSRHTFGRILSQAHTQVARALVEGQALRIDGGHYEVTTVAQNSAEPVSAKELNMSKVAVTSDGPTLQDQVDPRFGRAAGFVVVDTETMAFEYVDNGASQALSQGAGIQAAERIVSAGAGILLTGYVGPKAFTALKAAGVQVGQNLDGMTVAEAVAKYKAGGVELAVGPNR